MLMSIVWIAAQWRTTRRLPRSHSLKIYLNHNPTTSPYIHTIIIPHAELPGKDANPNMQFRPYLSPTLV